MSAYDRPNYLKQGLPNLGNTCYLNSAIQFLYSSEKLRQVLNQRPINYKAQNLAYDIRTIFEYISSNFSLYIKQICIKRIIRKIQSIDKKINCHTQQDFLQILMLILNKLFQENQGLQKLFTIQTENTCECGSFNTTNMFLTSKSSICLTCNTPIKVKILQQSDLLIIYNQKQDRMSKGLLYRQYSEDILYHCIAKIFHIELGSKKLGHYRASRLFTDNQFIEFSDQHVYQQFDKHPIYLLYQKVNKQNDQKAINKNIVQKFVKQLPPSPLPSIIVQTNIKTNQLYRCQLNLVNKVTASKAIKSSRPLYFRFKDNGVLKLVFMFVLNKQQFYFQIPPIQKKYSTKNQLKDQFFISFLIEYEQKMNQKIIQFYRQTKDAEEKAKFSKQNYEKSKKQITYLKDYIEIDFVRKQ